MAVVLIRLVGAGATDNLAILVLDLDDNDNSENENDEGGDDSSQDPEKWSKLERSRRF